MGRALTNIPFDEWLQHVFDHPVTKPQWHFDIEADYWHGPPVATTQFIIKAFENAHQLLLPFSDAQVNQGLWYLVDHSCSSMMVDVMDDPGVPWSDRHRCIRSIHSLFEQCFAARCSNHLSHLDEPGANPLNTVCYMWWDIFPAYGDPGDPSKANRDQAIMDVMRDILKMPSVPCCESALHGLGHWQIYYPDKVNEIVGEFLSATAEIPPLLLDYAREARKGMVL